MKHKHRFVAIPFTGQNAFNGKEALFNWRVECGICHKTAKSGDLVEEVKQSWWREVVPQSKMVSIVLP